VEPAQLREGLRKEGLYVAEGDPVLELVGICEVALADTVKTIERVTKQQADRVTAASAQIVTDAKVAAELIVNEAGEWAETRIKNAGEAAAASVLSTLRQEASRIERSSRMAVRAAWIAAIICLLTVCGLGGIGLAMLQGH
jgi:hypothetical protein